MIRSVRVDRSATNGMMLTVYTDLVTFPPCDGAAFRRILPLDRGREVGIDYGAIVDLEKHPIISEWPEIKEFIQWERSAND